MAAAVSSRCGRRNLRGVAGFDAERTSARRLHTSRPPRPACPLGSSAPSHWSRPVCRCWWVIHTASFIPSRYDIISVCFGKQLETELTGHFFAFFWFHQENSVQNVSSLVSLPQLQVHAAVKTSRLESGCCFILAFISFLFRFYILYISLWLWLSSVILAKCRCCCTTNGSSDPFVFTWHCQKVSKNSFFFLIPQSLRYGDTDLNVIISIIGFVVLEVRKEMDFLVKKIKWGNHCFCNSEFSEYFFYIKFCVLIKISVFLFLVAVTSVGH